jgi:hypothetical protein
MLNNLVKSDANQFYIACKHSHQQINIRVGLCMGLELPTANATIKKQSTDVKTYPAMGKPVHTLAVVNCKVDVSLRWLIVTLEDKAWVAWPNLEEYR